MKKVIEWIKSLFKCSKVEENSTVADECQKMMVEYPVTEKECTNPVADKPVKKSKKRGRPRKKKKEE